MVLSKNICICQWVKAAKCTGGRNGSGWVVRRTTCSGFNLEPVLESEVLETWLNQQDRKNGEFAKFSLTTHSHILLNNCGYTAYICNLKSSADSPLQIHQFAFHLQSILQLINPEWDIQNFRSVLLFRDIKGPYQTILIICVTLIWQFDIADKRPCHYFFVDQ